MNHTNSIQTIPADSINIGSIHDSSDIRAIEYILTLPVHSLVPASPIFFYGSASNPSSLLYDSSAEIVTPKVIPKLPNKPPNPVLYLIAEPDSDPSSSDYSLSESSDSSGGKDYRILRCAKKDKNKCCSKTCFNDPIKKVREAYSQAT